MLFKLILSYFVSEAKILLKLPFHLQKYFCLSYKMLSYF